MDGADTRGFNELLLCVASLTLSNDAELNLASWSREKSGHRSNGRCSATQTLQLRLLRFYADIIEDTDLEDLRPAGRGHSLVRREAIGVVGMIAPWNFPLSTLFFKLAPAWQLAAPQL